MKRVTILLIIFLLALMIGFAKEPIGETEAVNPIRMLAEAERIELAKLLYSYKSFTETAPDINFPHTLNNLLDSTIYPKLKGNPFIGYIYDEGVSLNGAPVSLHIRSAAHVGRYYPIFRKIFLHANQDRTKIEPQPTLPFALSICLADVTIKPIPAVTLEAILLDRATGKRFCIRTSTGFHKGLYEAMDLASRKLLLTLDFLGRRP